MTNLTEFEQAKLLVAEANNSLYGSHGYFHSLNGGSFDKYHLARGIEDLKERCRKQYIEIMKLRGAA